MGFRDVTRILILLALCFFQAAGEAEIVGQEELEKAVSANISRSAIFDFVRAEAKRLGVRAYLFGGTAASYAHYVRGDLLAKKGNERFQSDRFDYEIGTMFRHGQDLDIVVDGDEAKLALLEAELEKRFPFKMGSRSAWEVRPLRYARGTKEALLGNPEFLKQHSDSHSTGLVELTDPPAGEPRVKDLRDWDSPFPRFLEDVRLGRITAYHSPEHAETARFKAGLNPPIASVIRLLTKAFQFELNLSEKDLPLLLDVIKNFDPARDLSTSYARDWMERNGKKMIQQAVNVEYALDLLTTLGLKDKLARLGDPNRPDTLAWWVSREPARSFQIGSGDGPTAKELGLTELAHDTRSYEVYEAILRSPTGEPNLLLSRPGMPGEAAYYGPGFYTMPGSLGAFNTGYTTRFQLHPKARRGTDFEGPEKNGSIRVLNRRAVTVIPEGFGIGPVELFATLETMGPSQLGMFERIQRNALGRLRTLTAADRAAILDHWIRILGKSTRPVFFDQAKALVELMEPTPEESARIAAARVAPQHVAAPAPQGLNLAWPPPPMAPANPAAQPCLTSMSKLEIAATLAVAGIAVSGGIYGVSRVYRHWSERRKDEASFYEWNSDFDYTDWTLSGDDYELYRWLRKKRELGGYAMKEFMAKGGLDNIKAKGGPEGLKQAVELMREYGATKDSKQAHRGGSELNYQGAFTEFLASLPKLPKERKEEALAVLKDFDKLMRTEWEFASALRSTSGKPEDYRNYTTRLVEVLFASSDAREAWKRYTAMYKKLQDNGFPKQAAAVLALEMDGPHAERLSKLSVHTYAQHALEKRMNAPMWHKKMPAIVEAIGDGRKWRDIEDELAREGRAP